ncbi:MAG: sensor histidine kinase [Bacteroidales bacterium]|nr:sensor histidine kinase [Bacteroidales bacterium]
MLALAFYYRSVKKDSAMLLINQAEALSEKMDYKQGIAVANYRKSTLYRYKGELQKAIEHAKTYLEMAEGLSDTSMIAKASYNLALNYNIVGNPQKALTYHRIARAAFKAENNLKNLCAVNNAIGNLFSDIAFYDSAAIYYNSCIDIYVTMGNNIDKAIALCNLGNVYTNTGNYESAINILNESIELSIENIENNLYDNLANSYSYMGIVYYNLMDYAKSLYYYRLSDSVYSIVDNKRGTHNLQMSKAHIYNELKKYSLAHQHYLTALKYFREQGISDGIIVAWQGIADNYASQGLYKKAIVYYDSSLKLAKETGYILRQVQVLDNIYDFYATIGNYKEALNYHELLLKAKDSVLNQDIAFITSDLMFKYDTQQKELDLLKQKHETLRIMKQRNSFIYTFLGIIILTLYLILYFRTKHRKNKYLAEQKIRQLEEEKKLLAARFLVEGQEKERKRIASAIHDSLGVLLSASKMHVTAIKDSSPENKALIEKATKFLDDASGEMRQISHNMMPGLLTKMGLYEALEDLFENISDTEKIDALVELVGPKTERLPENHEIMIYRIVQEMVNNTLKHAGASKIDLVMVMHPDQLDINYSDNGKGFDVEEKIAQKSLGIQSIHSRVSFLDGQINVRSAPGKGTVYTIHIPLVHKEEE